MRVPVLLAVLSLLAAPVMAAPVPYTMEINECESSMEFALSIGGQPPYDMVYDEGSGIAPVAGPLNLTMDEEAGTAEMTAFEASLTEGIIITVDLSPWDNMLPGLILGWISLDTGYGAPLAMTLLEQGGPAPYDASGNIIFPQCKIAVEGESWVTSDGTQSMLDILIGFLLGFGFGGIPAGGGPMDWAAMDLNFTEDIPAVLGPEGPELMIPFEITGEELVGTIMVLEFGVNGIIEALVEPVNISLDVKPGSCPNPLNPGSPGNLPVAILGTEDLDVSTIDVDSIRLGRKCVEGAAAAVDSSIEDVGTPFEGVLCECHEEGADGQDDLVLKFDTQAIVVALDMDSVSPGEVIVLTITGNLIDGTPIRGTDCIKLVPPHKLLLKVRKGGTVDVAPAPDDPEAGTYDWGTEVTLTAVPAAGKRFKSWKIVDGDASAVIDTSNPVTIVMDADQEVIARFTCGGAGAMLPMMAILLGVFLFIRRRA